MSEKLYAERDAEALGDLYFKHLNAMTAEGLHSKGDIAAELAWRDRELSAAEEEIRELTEACEGSNARIAALEAERKPIMSCGELLDMLTKAGAIYRSDAHKSLVRSQHQNWLTDHEVDAIPQSVIDALLVDFINYIGIVQGLNWGLYVRDWQQRAQPLPPPPAKDTEVKG